MTDNSPPDIPTARSIELFFHCRLCFPLRPENVAPSDWAMLEVGWTQLGIQVWCKRCDANICHIDFEGQQHPAMVGR